MNEVDEEQLVVANSSKDLDRYSTSYRVEGRLRRLSKIDPCRYLVWAVDVVVVAHLDLELENVVYEIDRARNY